ncbi:MAG TPA: LysM peptidoglycan-binding domain-containing protein [Acidimicrobiales bacterium]|nr:LysM peptidoglycan-binding domain-containing protein [Acidimicrobiales bacterium]
MEVVAALVDYPRDVRLEMYRRRRLAAGAALLIGLALLIMVSTLAVQAALGRTGGGPLTATGALPGGQLAGSEVYVVRPGNTIWSIARSVDPNGDVRPLVDRISSQLGGTQLHPGERLTLPLNR